MEDKTMRQKSIHVIQAKDILSKKVPKPGETEILALTQKLKQEKVFGYARKLLGLALESLDPAADSQLRLKFAQEHALCTYKDPDLPVSDRLAQALKMLNMADNLLKTKNQETLGLAAAIYKRIWEADGQKQNLERSHSYYERGYREGSANDYGYTGINAAYVLDQLASLEEAEAKETGTISELAKERRLQAQRIREDLVSKLPDLMETDNSLASQYWFLVTIAEAYYGLGHYRETLPWLEKAAALPNIPPWGLETTARQLTSIIRLQHDIEGKTHEVEESEGWKVLQKFLGDNIQGVRGTFIGKVGLGLSGGGIRASLFHIGVLAKLAELDVLRHVEVLSCVSGGSIVGAHYYLEIRKLLKEKPDDQISREDYIEIVKRISQDFLAGVQRNIRTRVAAEFTTNLKMIFKRNYSRTERVGELYEEELYARIDDGEGNQPRWLNDLFIHPKGEDKNFAPKHDNWHRASKVPMLILNATTLNTGHNWQFTASWMGEPPIATNSEVDSNYRLRRMYYKDAPPEHQSIRLGHAVAASSCIPGLFEPIVLDRLYEGITVHLVDGGVYDNQGIMGLLEQDCTVIIVSDASGQMGTQDNPSIGSFGVSLRSNSILLARVREAEYRELEARRQSGVLRNLMFIHLKKDLDVKQMDWIGCQDPTEFGKDKHSVDEKENTEYGILKEVQEHLADIRTDLDSFCDIEAFALMTSGYRMLEFEFKKQFSNSPVSTEEPLRWEFLSIEYLMTDKANYGFLLKLLRIASQSALKIWMLSKSLKVVGMIVALAVVIAFLAASLKWPSLPILTLGMIGTSLLFIVIGLFVSKYILRIVNLRETITQIAVGFGRSLFGWGIARLHLHVFDKWYLKAGSWRREHQKKVWARKVLETLRKSNRVNLKIFPELDREYIQARFQEENDFLNLIFHPETNTLEVKELERLDQFINNWNQMKDSTDRIDLETCSIASRKLTDVICEPLVFRRIDEMQMLNQLFTCMLDASNPEFQLNIRAQFPIVYLPKNSITEEVVNVVFGLLNRFGIHADYFALLIAFEKHEALRRLVSGSAYKNNFIVLDFDMIWDILASKSPVRRLIHFILKQIDLVAVSPYTIAGPVSEKVFFGRASEEMMLLQNINRNDYVLLANRKMGKTSLLNRIAPRLERTQSYNVFYCDLQNVLDYDSFYNELRESYPNLMQEIDKISEPAPRDFAKIIRNINRNNSNRQTILIFDEVDELLAFDLEHKEILFKTFRSLSQRENVRFIFSGTTMLPERFRHPDSPLFNFCEVIKIGRLEGKAARDLVTVPMHTFGVKFEDEENIVQRILDITARHPNMIQYTCTELIKTINEKQRRSITLEDLEMVLHSEQFFEYFEGLIWGQSSNLHKFVVYIMWPYSQYTKANLIDEFHKRGLSSNEIESSLVVLEIYGILRKEKENYSFAYKEFAKLMNRRFDIDELAQIYQQEVFKND